MKQNLTIISMINARKIQPNIWYNNSYELTNRAFTAVTSYTCLDLVQSLIATLYVYTHTPSQPITSKNYKLRLHHPCSHLFLSIKPIPKYLYFLVWLLSYCINITFTLKIQEISVIIRRHGTVINTIYKHHPVLSVYEIKIRNLLLAAYTIILWLKTICINTFFKF